MSLFGDAQIVSMYTRDQAIEDGVLVDLTQWAGPAEMSPAWPVPVAATTALWEIVEAIPKSKRHQDIRGRTHDLLFMSLRAFSHYARRHQGRIHYGIPIPVRLIMHHGRRTYLDVKIIMTAEGPGPDAQPCVTLMLPTES